MFLYVQKHADADLACKATRDHIKTLPPLPDAYGSGSHKLSSSPKLPRVFASGYVNTASVLYFLNFALV